MKTIIVFSHLRWNFVFQRPQHLLSRLASHYKILFVEEPVNKGSVFIEVTQVAPNVKVLLPHTVELGWGFADDQNAVLSPMLKAWLHEYPEEIDGGYGIWFYTPLAFPLATSFGPEFIVFDVMDDLSMFKYAPSYLKDRERELLRIADIIIAGGPSLLAARLGERPDTLDIPSAVDIEHYSPKRALEAETLGHEEDKLEHDIPHPRLGFFGVIDERLDVDLIAAIADADPHWHVMMVGPTFKIDPAELPQRPNIHWLGQQPYALLPQIVQGWDVCLLPFIVNNSTRFISPTKTLEYMAAEKPIVSTAINDVVSMYGKIVEISNTHEEFIEKIKFLLNEPAEHAEARINAGKLTVSLHLWDDAAEKIHVKIEEVLKKKEAS